MSSAASRADHAVVPVNPSDTACIELVNSTFTDHLGSRTSVDRVGEPSWQRWFLQRYELTPRPSGQFPLEAFVRVRRDLRRVLERWSEGELTQHDVRLLDGRLREVELRRRVTLTRDGLESKAEPVERNWAWVIAAVTGSAVDLMTYGEPHRLKVCANPDCSWMFYDRTVNGSKQFCSTSPCGSLVRVRRFRSHD